MTDKEQVRNIIKENDRRNEAIYAKFNPVTGEGSIGERTKVCISDFVMPEQWFPNSMMKIPFVKKLIRSGSIEKFLTDVLHITPNDTDRRKVSKKLIRLRYNHDFAFWAATLALGSGEENKINHFPVKFPYKGKIQLDISPCDGMAVAAVHGKSHLVDGCPAVILCHRAPCVTEGVGGKPIILWHAHALTYLAKSCVHIRIEAVA